MNNRQKARFLALFAIVLVISIIVAVFAYSIAMNPKKSASTAKTPSPTPTATPTPIIAAVSPTPTSLPILPSVNPASVLGISNATVVENISWVRLGYPSCGTGGLAGSVLKKAVDDDHSHGLRVLVILCQSASSGPGLLGTKQFTDISQSDADAVQCGNEQMKQNAQTRYVSPDNFARFYDLCYRAVRKTQPNVPVLMGALDPHVGGIDVAPLEDQVAYLNQMQDSMNSQVHPGGHWQWRSQIIGLIDSWHNGYPNQFTNSLYNLFQFWSQQFGVTIQSGGLNRHLWVVEGTGCFQGCGLDPNNSYQIAVSHVLTLITDVQTSLQYKIPFFYFSAKDFVLDGVRWPIGILDLDGHPKPIRQDLPMGARSLNMSCAKGTVRVVDQAQLLFRMYQGCKLPDDYITTLVN